MKILVVEDDPLLSNLVDIKLTSEGHQVSCAYNGKDGLEKAHEKRPDMIILDLAMPIMDGFEMLKILKEGKEFNNIPVIVFSSLGEKERNLEECKRLGADLFLVKSQLSLKEVVASINDLAKKKGIIS